MVSHVIRYGVDSTRPHLETAFSGHYPGTGWEARPNRYQTDPDNPAITLPHTYAPGGEVRVFALDEIATNGIPQFVWEAAGKDGLPINHSVDGVQYYDGNWGGLLDANGSVDYIVNYSFPSWNNQFSGIFKPGWIAGHRLDGSIAPNSAWNLPCTESDTQTDDEGPTTGNGWGYDGDITLYPDTNAPANLKKAMFTWVGSAYGFGVFTVQNVAATVTAQPQDTSVMENTPLTLSTEISGSPNSYRWFKNNLALEGTATNADGSLRYPP